MERILGKSGIVASAVGMGCWAIGGPWNWTQPGEEPFPAGWGKTDDEESIRAIHAGEYLGIPPTGKVVDVRLMDFYRREGDLIIENWVPIDMIHLLLQIGFDVFGELRSQVD